MKKIHTGVGSRHPWLLGILAGLAGGFAEMIWVGIYCTLTPLTTAEVAREVTLSVMPVFLSMRSLAVVGVFIHLMLSIAIGIGYTFGVWPYVARRAPGIALFSAVAVLVAIWATNFFVLLPMLNPTFVSLMPYPVTLASKLLFAIAVFSVLPKHRSVRHSLSWSV